MMEAMRIYLDGDMFGTEVEARYAAIQMTRYSDKNIFVAKVKNCEVYKTMSMNYFEFIECKTVFLIAEYSKGELVKNRVRLD